MSIGLLNLGAVCEMSVVVPQQEEDGTQVSGSDTGDDGGSTPIVGNPNSPCSDQTDIYVSFVNQSTAKVGFVENFRDEENHSLSAAIWVLQAAGDSGDTRNKCITCPWQAGIRNIKYILNGETTWVSYPEDLFRGDFTCGDNITFTFKENGSVETSVETP